MEYPTEEELRILKYYDVVNDLEGFLEYLESIYNANYGSFELTGKKIRTLRLATGGWSGNEDIVRELPLIFTMSFWYKSQRGGLHIYKIERFKKR